MIFFCFFLLPGFFLCLIAEFHLRINKDLSPLILLFVSSVRLKKVCLHIITEFQIQDVFDFFLDLFILYREYDLSHDGPDFAGHQSALPI